MSIEIEYLAGCQEPEGNALRPFDTSVMEFLAALSEEIRKEESLREYPEIKAFGFWCRSANLFAMKKSFQREGDYIGRGLIFHVTASNVPGLFAYSLVISMLSGNANMVRISSRCSWQDKEVTRILGKLLSQAQYEKIYRRTSIIAYERDDELTARLMNRCDGYVVWGGDATVNHIRHLVENSDLIEVVFPDRYSICLMGTDGLKEYNEDQIQRLAHRFYQDTYAMHQNACSSPQMICWITSDMEDTAVEQIQNRFWAALKEELGAFQLQDNMAFEKFETITRMTMERPEIISVMEKENKLFVASLSHLAMPMEAYRGRFGLFYQVNVGKMAEIASFTSGKLQTITFAGLKREEVLDAAIKENLKGFNRIVPVGEALQMGLIWDGQNLADVLTKCIG